VHLSVVAKGSGPFSYKWYKWPATGNGVVVGSLQTLSFPSVATADAGTYSVLVSGGGNGSGAPVLSERVVLAVSTARGVAVLSQPQDASYAEGVSAVVRTVTDAGDGDTIETRYTLCALQNGVPVATSLSGPVPSDGILDLSLRQVTAGGSYVVRFNRLYGDGGNRFWCRSGRRPRRPGLTKACCWTRIRPGR
jgi:hypothetical protein